MRIVRLRSLPAGFITACLVLMTLAVSISTVSAQNKKRAWEIYIYFGEYGSQTVPSAIQKGLVSTYRLDPYLAESSDATDPNTRFCLICRNLGATGPTNQYLGPPLPPPNPNPSPTIIQACPRDSVGNADPSALDPNTPYLDECDDDLEASYRYNANGILTNHEVQRNSSEFLLGGRLGYNITRHWEVELDLGFAKQRLDMTKNLIPLLTEKVSNPADPFFQRLADFYEFTWANRDYLTLGLAPQFSSTDPNIVASFTGLHEIPNVPQHRFSRNAGADIPALFPMPLASAETFPDVTAFVNRVLLDPGAFRNRANQINTDIVTTGLSAVYNFNTKPDKRIIPYLQAGTGLWQRSYDSPYKGENSNYFTYGGGVRFFVNEIFSFRAEFRQVIFKQSTVTITGSLPRQNLVDVKFLFDTCPRDQDPPVQQPPQECSQTYLDYFSGASVPTGFKGTRADFQLPANAGPGGRASVTFITETDNFWEARVGFDVLLGGK